MSFKKEEELKFILYCLERKNLSLAKSKLNQLLIICPNDYILENIYGFILSKENNYTDAIFRFRRSIKINPNFADGYYNLASSLSKISLYDEAIDNFKKAISCRSNYFDAYYNLANVHSKTLNFLEANNAYKICLSILPNSIDVLNNFGINLTRLKKYDYAIEIFNKVIKLDKDNFSAYNNLGMVYCEINDSNKAILYYNEAIKIKLDYFEAYENLGFVYFSIKNYSEAIFFYKKAIELNKYSYSAHTNLGNVYSVLKNYEEAILFHKKAIEIKEDFYEAYINLATTYKESRKRIIDAISVLKKVISLKKQLPDAYNSLALCYQELGEPNTASEYFEKSLAIEPNNINTYSWYIFNSLYIKNFEKKKYFELTNKFFKLVSDKSNYIIKSNKYHKSEKKLKVGFVSADFKNHPIGFFIEGLLPFLKNDSNLEIFAFSNNSFEDSLTQRIKILFNEWISIYSNDDLTIVNKIMDRKIDILVDLSGHTNFNNLSVFFHKPAPIQVSWAGYLASAGLDKIDYIITDPYVESKTNNHQFLEKTYKMPNVWCHFSKPIFDLFISENIPALKNGFITFGSFNDLSKINFEVINLWSKILQLIPNSKIFLKTSQLDDAEVREVILKKFLKNNIDSNRIILEGYSDRKTLLEKYNLVDIALDPFPYNGGTTSFEASWMCVPILTLSGDTFVSRCGVSININLDMKDWIAEDNFDYLNKAVQFSSNLEELNIVKKKLYNQKKISKIFDSENFALDLVSAFKDMSKCL